MNRFPVRSLVALLLALAAMAAGAAEPGPEAWKKIHEVFSHPRCANCHVGAEGVPMWSAAKNTSKPHGMNIRAGNSRMGAENGTL